MQQVDEVTTLDAEGSCPFVAEALTALCQEVGNATTVLGFVGAPFTLACYIVEVSPADKPGTEFTTLSPWIQPAAVGLLSPSRVVQLPSLLDRGTRASGSSIHPVYCVAQHCCC